MLGFGFLGGGLGFSEGLGFRVWGLSLRVQAINVELNYEPLVEGVDNW